jgi:multisubunit Na+/H+ antiporter MnhB subunit
MPSSFRTNRMPHPAFWPFLVGFIPIFLARSGRARIVAALFGLASVGLGFYFVWGIHNSPDGSLGVERVGKASIGGLIVAVVSSLATYFVDRRQGRKS